MDTTARIFRAVEARTFMEGPELWKEYIKLYDALCPLFETRQG
jgi:hypothetical protein